MVQIYSENNTNYDYNGDVVLDPIACDLKVTLNGSWEITLECPLDDQEKFQAILTNAVICTNTPVGKKQRFRIYDVQRSDTGVIAYARPIFLDSAKDVFFVDRRPTDMSGQEALDYLMEGTPYSGHTDITLVKTAYYIRKNLIEALAGNEENSFLNRWGGEIIYDNYNINILVQQGEDRGLRVEFGTNIESIQETIDVDELGTRLVPVAFNGRTLDGDEPWVDSPLINNYPIIYYKIVEFDDMRLTEDFNLDEDGNPTEDTEDYEVFDTLAELQAAMVERCEQLFVEGVDTPAITYDINMLDLRRADEYKDYQDLETVNLGDTVYCYHRRLGIETRARVIEYTYDCIRECITEVVIGDYQEDYLDHLSDITSSSGGTVDFSQIWSQFEYIEANYVRTNQLEAEVARFGYLTAAEADITYARITDLEAALIEVNELIADEIYAVYIDVATLDASVANIISLLGGDIATGTLDTIHLTADNAVIDSEVVLQAIIEEAIIGDLLAGVIYTDQITIMDNENGDMVLTGPTIQFKDSDGNYRMQVGLDAEGNFNIYIFNEAGDVIFDALGLTEAGLIGNGAIIRDVAVADDANISGYKLNIQEVATILNEDGSLIVDAGQVIINGETLSTVYTEIRQDVDSALTEAEKALEAAGELIEIGARNYLLNTRDLDYEADKTIYTDWELSQDESDFGVLQENGDGSVLMLTAISAEKNSLSGKKMVFAADLFEENLTSILDDYDLEFGIYWSRDNGATWEDYGVINSSMAEDTVFEFNRDDLSDDEWCRLVAKFTATASHIHTTTSAPVFTWDDADMTCTATYTCNDCGETITNNCTVTTETVDATCENDGLITYTASIRIGDETYTDIRTETIPALGHDWDMNHMLTVWADDHSSCKLTLTCSDCGESFTFESASVTSEITKEATCTDTGIIKYTAIFTDIPAGKRGTTITQLSTNATIPALGHEYGEPTFEWADDYSGCTAVFACSRGDDTQRFNCAINIVTIFPTCTTEGMTTYTATVTFDGKTYTDTREETTPALDHDYGTPTFEWADDFKKCTATFKCLRCDTEETLDCTVTVDATEPTCEDPGESVYTATVTFNGQAYTDTKTESTAALGHDYGEPMFEWADDYSSCTAVFACSRGDDTQTFDCIVDIVTISPTCTTEGMTTYTATVTFDGKTYTDTREETTPALGHIYGTPVFSWIKSVAGVEIPYEEGNDVVESGQLGNAVYYNIYDNGLCKIYGSGDMYEYSPMNLSNLSPLYQNGVVKIIVIDGKVANVGSAAFYGMSALTAVDMSGSNITSIDSNAFQDCTALKEIVFSYALKQISPYAFNGCTALNSITFIGNAPEIVDNSYAHAFENVTATCYYPDDNASWESFDFQDYGGSLTWAATSFEGSTYTCTVTATCGACSFIECVDCTVTTEILKDPTCTDPGEIAYIATCEFEGQTYTDIYTDTIEALGHEYGDAVFDWADDFSSCIATFTCARGDDIQSFECLMDYTYTYPTCTEPGGDTYTATCVFNGKTYTDSRTITEPALGHDYGSPDFNWADDFTKCTAIFTCQRCGDEVSVDCDVTIEFDGDMCTTGGITTYTATVTFEGETYSMQVTKYVEATGHDYGAPTFNWSDDFESCTATFVCEVCGDTETVNCTVTTEGKTATATVTFEGQIYTDEQELKIAVAFAVYCADDGSLTFYAAEDDADIPAAGNTYNNKAVSDVFTDFENSTWTGTGQNPWYSIRTNITSIEFDVSFKEVKLISMAYWFYSMTNLSDILNISNINGSKLETLAYAFYGCSALTNVDALADLDTSNVTSLQRTFYNCTKLTDVNGLKNWDTSAVTTLNYIFGNCSQLTEVAFSGWNTSKVTNMSSVFYYCSNLVTIDVSKWDTSMVTNMSSMFQYCSKLETIYSDDNVFVTTSVTTGSSMFSSCSKLVGGNGTAYSSSNVTHTMAHVDTASNPGYFTQA